MKTQTENIKPQAIRTKPAGVNGHDAISISTAAAPLALLSLVGSIGTAQEKSHQVLAITRLLREVVALTPAGQEQAHLNAEGLELMLGQVEQGLQAVLGALAESVDGARHLGTPTCCAAH